ncbi:hypothetical protein [Anaeromyxobacter paludicola]|uniref:Uncharacterized protein n=1 Tax=Anaeromyxobacter paludicola TaxID=2918171 RepID=A0ABM7X957_9BACT|nr:hypothetical protein [Anaeromyxobacter paludicola]BDG08384.1 hypothetical protein AMPC_14970 [Anaeromyxobacter paludicola]
MTRPTSSRVILLAGAGASRRRVRELLRWTRALVPAVVLVASPGDASARSTGEDGIELNAESIASGPLALAHALVRAAGATSAPDRPDPDRSEP